MEHFDSSKVHVEYRNGVTKENPIMGRKYTVTHSDETAELFVTIGIHFAKDKVSIKLRDEVFLGFTKQKEHFILLGTVLIDAKDFQRDSQKRSEIFLREMPRVLMAIRYADATLFEKNPRLNEIPILIWFQSTKEQYNKMFKFGTMEMYKTIKGK